MLLEVNQAIPKSISGRNLRLDGKIIILLIVLASVPVFYFSGFVGGYLKDPISMSSELKSPASSLASWELSNEAPFKYRFLFKAVVMQVSSLFFASSNRGFYYAYILVSYACFLATMLTLYAFIKNNGFSRKLILIGLGLFLVSPVILMAYKIPVHLREDYMSYFILLVGLIAIQKNNSVLLMITFITGSLCRETLLILPFTYLFFTSNHSLIKRLFFSLIPVLIFVLIRFLIGLEEYDYFSGLRWNLENPSQVIGFSVITYHFMWIPLIVYLFTRRQMNLAWTYIDKSLVPVIGLIIITTFIGGIFSEIRLLFLAFPWIIIAILRVIEQNNQLGFSGWFSQSKIKAFLIFQPFMIYILFYLLSKTENLKVSAYAVHYNQWIVISLIYIELMLFAFIHYLPAIKMIYKQKASNETI